MDFDDILKRGEAALAEAVTQGQVEGLTLDFKESNAVDPLFDRDGKTSRRGREVIGKAISAFANSAGGLVILGVECKNKDGIDEASSLSPIPDFSRCSSSLVGLGAQLVLPRVDGLRFGAVPAAGVADCGYVLIDVPRSERRPHMSQPDRHYYKRSGASSFMMEHYDIEDAYRRHTAPILDLALHFRGGISASHKETIVIDLLVRNSGHATAKSVTLSLGERNGWPFRIGDIHSGDMAVVAEVAGKTLLVRDSAFYVNPGEQKRVESLFLTLIAEGDEGDEHLRIGDKQFNGGLLSVEYSLSAENTWPSEGTILVRPQDLSAFELKLRARLG